MKSKIRYINKFSPEESIFLKEMASSLIEEDTKMLDRMDKESTEQEKIDEKELYLYHSSHLKINKLIAENPDIMLGKKHQNAFMVFGSYPESIKETDMRKKRLIKKSIINKIEDAIENNPVYIEFITGLEKMLSKHNKPDASENFLKKV